MRISATSGSMAINNEVLNINGQAQAQAAGRAGPRCVAGLSARGRADGFRPSAMLERASGPLHCRVAWLVCCPVVCLSLFLFKVLIELNGRTTRTRKLGTQHAALDGRRWMCAKWLGVS